jgi:U3 small nucleolar RNA-associated protein 14
MRALLFYQEQKHKRVKKIKSKMYRKIRKKQRDKHANEVREHIRITDPELAKELDEKDLRKRAQERFSLRHKNMSKWAKNALKHGQIHAPGTKEAIEESLRIGQELKRKRQTMNSDSSSGDDESSDGEDEDEDGGVVFRNDGGATSKAKKLLQQIENDQQDSLLSSKKGLMSLKFMQNAVSRQREHARNEALGLLDELDGTEGLTTTTSSSNSKKKKNGRKSMGGAAAATSEQASTSSTPSTSTSTSAKKRGGTLQSQKVQFSGGTRTKMGSGMTVNNVTTSEMRLDNQDQDEDVAKVTAVSKKNINDMVSSWGGTEVPSWNNDEQEEVAEDDTEQPSTNNGKEEDDQFSSSSDDDDKEEDVEEDDDDGKAELPALLDVDALSYRELQGELKKRSQKGKGKKVLLVKILKEIVEKERAELLVNAREHKHKKKQEKNQNRSKKTEAINKSSKIGSKSTMADGVEKDEEEEESNPWLAPQSSSSGSSSTKKSSKKRKRSSTAQSLDVQAALSALDKDTLDEEDGDSQSTLQAKQKKKTQSELVQMAFAVDDRVEEEFEKEKNSLNGQENGKSKAEPVLMGWGSWTGAGAKMPRKKKKKKVKHSQHAGAAVVRKDKHLKHVIISEKRNKRAAKYLVPSLPHEYDNREQYERSLRNPIGPEWNTSDAYAKMTRPQMIVRGGNVIAPIKMPKQYKRKLTTINAEFSLLQKAKRAKRNSNRKSRL